MDGFAVGCGTLLIVTLFWMNEVPTGIVSVTSILLAGMVPVYYREIVYVMISPNVTVSGVAIFCGFNIAVFTFVMLIGVGSVMVTGGSPGTGSYVKVTVA